MKDIKHTIIQVRSLLLKQDAIIGLIYIGLFYLLFFLFYIQFESIFYFTPAIKSKVVIFLILSIISFLILYLYQYFQAINGKIKKYELNQVSKFLGEKLYPNKSDQILNALQIESSLKPNESEQLAKLFVKKHIKLLVSYKFDRVV